jgi:hypothetical protein
MQQLFFRTSSANPEPTVDEPQFHCNFSGCTSRPFKRRGDLKRHRLGHTSEIQWSCPAEDCSRTGSNGFERLDKLMDHVLGGHKRETHFRCPVGGEGSCGMPHQTFPRDLAAIHAHIHHDQVSKILHRSNGHRDCPILRCPFRINTFKESTLDGFQLHLVTEHSPRVRADHTSLIGSRGYDAATGNVVCPICTKHFQYPGHFAFYCHLFDVHLHVPVLWEASKRDINSDRSFNHIASMGRRSIHIHLMMRGYATKEIHQHQRTILSLWPLFEAYSVFDKIRGGPFPL